MVYIFFGKPEEDPLQKRLRELTERNVVYAVEEEETSGLAQNIGKLFDPIVASVIQRVDPKSIKQLLLEAGLSSGDEDVYKHLAQKVIFGIAGLFLAFFLCASGNVTPLIKILLLVIIPMACYRLPDFKLRKMAKTRFEEITYNLSDALDLLTVCIEAGLGLDAAFVRVANELDRTCPILAKELARVSKDIMSGISRADAFRALANRNNVPDLRSFVALLIQTDKLGTSISTSLRVYSDTMRTKRRQRAEKLAAQASVKMVIPLVLFILPSMFVVLLTPAALTLVKSFMNMH